MAERVSYELFQMVKEKDAEVAALSARLAAAQEENARKDKALLGLWEAISSEVDLSGRSPAFHSRVADALRATRPLASPATPGVMRRFNSDTGEVEYIAAPATPEGAFAPCADCITERGCARENRCKWPGHALPASPEKGESALAKGCCSAISPCAHQRRDPSSICEVCATAGGLLP